VTPTRPPTARAGPPPWYTSAVRRTAVIASLVVGLSAVGASNAAAASCGSLKDPFAGTRFSGETVSSVHASGVSCTTARSLAKKAMYRSLVMGKPGSGRVRLTIDGYRVRGDLRGSTDRFTAENGRRKVTWSS
jgi:hypothetical protein